MLTRGRFMEIMSEQFGGRFFNILRGTIKVDRRILWAARSRIVLVGGILTRSGRFYDLRRTIFLRVICGTGSAAAAD